MPTPRSSRSECSFATRSTPVGSTDQRLLRRSPRWTTGCATHAMEAEWARWSIGIDKLDATGTTHITLHRDSFRYIVNVSEAQIGVPAEEKDIHMNTPFTPPDGPFQGRGHRLRLRPRPTGARCTNSAGRPVATSATTSANTAATRRLRPRLRLRSRLRPGFGGFGPGFGFGPGGRGGRRGGPAADAAVAGAAGAVTCAPPSSSCSPTGRCTATR